jgi:hypothetical protein
MKMKMKRKTTILLTTMLAVSLTAQQAMSATVCGFAQNAQGPVSGVIVEIKNSSGTVMGTATTDARGRYSISGLSPGTLELFVDPSSGVQGGSGVLNLTGDSRRVNWQVSDASSAVATEDGVCRAGALTPIEWASIGVLGLAVGGGIAAIVWEETGDRRDHSESPPPPPFTSSQ